MGRLHAAVDVGGTFTDVVMVDTETRMVAIAKLPSEKSAQGKHLVGAVEQLAKRFGADAKQIDTVVIGTTVVTNALLEGALARTGLITTEGFRDVLEIARMERPASYNLHRRRPAPLVPRYLRLEVKERVDADGKVIRALAEDSVVEKAETLRAAGVQSVAVCLLFSFANANHEQRVGEILARELAIPVALSSDVLPVFREYERTSTTVINAATIPVINRFIDELNPLLTRGARRVYVMGSEGGCLTLPEARRYPARCIMSGPAGGVIGGLQLAGSHGFDNALTLDVGGTSTDVALVQHGILPYTETRAVAGYSVALPSVEVETVGAGGGSIAYVDTTGLLKVGPMSAGADPGPICYQRGGIRPTVTDAQVALGRLGERTMLGGEFKINREAAVSGIQAHLGQPLGIGWVRAAQGTLEVVTANIVRAVRAISVERGHDPRKLTLVAFGGAGPLHAVDVARLLEIPRVLIPRFPGVWSAYGILSSEIRYSAYRTWFKQFNDLVQSDLHRVFEHLAGGLVDRAVTDGLDPAILRTDRAMDLRYRGQSHTLTVPITELSDEGARRVVDDFHGEHERRYGHAAPGAPLEIVNLRVTLIYPRFSAEEPGLSVHWSAPDHAGSSSLQYRQTWFSGPEPMSCPIYQRAGLAPRQVLEGPAIVEQYDSTVVLLPGDRMEVMGDGLDLLIQVNTSGGKDDEVKIAKTRG